MAMKAPPDEAFMRRVLLPLLDGLALLHAESVYHRDIAPDNVLLPGQFVRARLLTGERDGVFKVPQNAVMQTDMGAVVMLANADNKVEPRPVKTGNWSGKDWVILGGLKAGDKVIVDNLIKIRPGAPVAPHGPGEGPGAPGGQPGAPAAAPAKG